MESYLMSPPAISRLIMNAQNLNSVEEAHSLFVAFLRTLGIVINDDYKQSDRTLSNTPLFNLDAKELLDPICKHFNIDKFSIAKEMREEDIFDDVKTLINEIVELCR